MMNFDKLENRYVLKARLRNEGGLHIGTGVAGTQTDAPFIRMGDDAFIPGSSLRGVLRSQAERLMHLFLEEGTYCQNFDEAKDCASVKDKSKRGKEFCPICQFFGSLQLASRFKVSDAVQTVERPAQPVRRDGVGIDRDTETARDQIKFDFEVLERGTGFEFTMQVENAGQTDFAILHLLVMELKNGVDVGGKRSRGLGQVVMESDYEVRYFDQEGAYSLMDYLTEGKLETMKTIPFEDKLRGSFQQAWGRKEKVV